MFDFVKWGFPGLITRGFKYTETQYSTEKRMIQRSKAGVMRWSWGLVLAWFSASLLSQAAYIGTHGMPYDATILIHSLGQWSWVLIALEGIIWLMVGKLLFNKYQSVRTQNSTAA